jgi:hypothetical protein
VELQYLGHTFCYQPSERCLLWAVVPGQYMIVSEAAQVALIAELDPYQPAPPAVSAAPVRQLAARPTSADDLYDFG